jgi:mono/diheme cytochrome c family protein
MKKYLRSLALVAGAIIVLVALIITTGVYDVAADDAHTAVVHKLLETTRDRSIAVRADDVTAPELSDPQRIRRGAGNYNAMCAECHLKPGGAESEISRGLYPRPPELALMREFDPARAFWIIKHGIKATGMPAWGKSMEDEYIWDMVAFLKLLPKMSAEEYAAEVRASGGHSHGGGETADGNRESADHSHEEGSEEGEHSHGDDDHSNATSDESESSSHEHALQAAEAGAEQKLAQSGSDPIATVKAFHASLSSGDAAGVQAILDPKVLIMESRNVERSREEYASHHLPSDMKFMRAIRYQLQRQSGDTVGDLAWVASEATLTGEVSGKPVDVISTESLVLKKTARGWKIVHIHWSSRNSKKA